MSNLKEWSVPVTWSMCGTVKIKAETLEDAMDKVRYDDDSIALPEQQESSYVDGSFELSFDDTEMIRKAYNHDQEDG